MKTCNKCGITKELIGFNKDPRNKDGLQGICVDCRRLAKQKIRQKNSMSRPTKIIQEKTCNKCNETQPVESFYKDTGIADGHSTICKKCKNHNVQNWRESHREDYNASQREQHRKNYLRNRLYRYDLTPEQYLDMVKEQDNKCKMCGKGPTEKRPLAIDHDHKTGKVRGLLCYGCNRVLNAFDSAEAFENAMKYLNKHKA